MTQHPLISVVIATYNGSKFLPEQLDSIYNQTYKNIEVIVCDDKSTDATVEILKRYQETYGLRYYINEHTQGVIKNFEKGISYATGSYIALSDQDDVWLPNKLALSLDQLREVEGEYTTGGPAILFTDLAVVDEKLTPIHPSYWNYMQLNPAHTQLNRVLVENVVTGCTLLMNKAAVDLALPIPKEALMHDVWFLLVTTCFGKVTYLPEKTVLYRQHNQNVVGARQASWVQKLSSGYAKIKQRKFSLLEPEIKQAESFYRQYLQRLSADPEKQTVLKNFISLKGKDFFNRKYLLVRHAFYGSTWAKAVNVILRA